MYSRMSWPRIPRARMVAAGLVVVLLSGCNEHVADRPAPARPATADVQTVIVAQATRTERFAESARRLRTHPALGPHTPAEIKRRVAELVEPIRLASPPDRQVLAAGALAPSIMLPQAQDEPRTQVASLAPIAPPATRATVEHDTARGAPQPDESQRTTPRNVVIPMVVSSADGNWRADSGDGSGKSGASRNAHCRAEALDQLKQLSATGYRIYERLSDKKMFTTWILCDDRQRGLTTAVHEGVHMLTEQLDAFPLVSGGQVKRIAALERFMRPGRIAREFTEDDFVKTYLMPGGASSADDFTYLLDEFNAYIHDLNTAIQTQAMAPRDARLGHRDGMSAMMSFLMAYVARAEKEDARTWAGLHRPDVKHLVTTLWSEAERTIEKSCKVPRYSVDDRAYLNHICASANGRALGHMLGRAPRCPRACLGDASG